MDLQENRDQQVLVPDLQSTLTFHEKPLIAVRLANGDHGVVLRWICENLHLDVTAHRCLENCCRTFSKLKIEFTLIPRLQ